MRIATAGRRSTRAAGIGLVLAGTLALVGCGTSGQSQDGVATANGRTEDRPPASSPGGTEDLSRWTKCLRDNGVDVQDPDPSTGVIRMPGNGDSPTLQAAMQKCEQFNTGAKGSTGVDPNDPEQQAARLKFAKCMRGKGIDWPDPVPGQPLSVPAATPQLKAAMEVCGREVPVGGK